jgi:hypothetical protein
MPGPRGRAGDVKIPPGGIPIPAEFKDVLRRYDKNGDGKLSAEEIEAMPAPLRDRIKEAIRQRMGGKPEAPAREPSPKEGAPKKP